MVTLDDIAAGVASAEAAAMGAHDPRTPITSLPFRIDAPGTFRLTSDLTATPGSPGIVIAASDVDIDLGGFRLLGQTLGTTGILGEVITPESTDIFIHDGTVSGWSEDGVLLESNNRVTLENLRVADCQHDGVALGNHAQVRRCVISGSGENGLQAGAGCLMTGTTVTNSFNTGVGVSLESVITDCVITDNGLGTDGAGADVGGGGIILGGDTVLERCALSGNRGTMGFFFGFGVLAIGQCVVRDCVVTDNAGFGIAAAGRIVDNVVRNNGGLGGITTADGVVSGNTSHGNTGFGINATNAIILNNKCTGNSAQGIRSGGRCLIDGNLCTFNDVGIDASTGDNLVVRNACFSNPTNDYVAGDGTAQQVDPGVNFANSLIPHPWANFEN